LGITGAPPVMRVVSRNKDTETQDTAMSETHGEAYGRAIEPMWDRISIYDGPDVFLRTFATVKPEAGHLFAAHWCQSEVRNGGFHQFFYNSTGVLAPEAVEGFRAIGLPDCAEILQEAMSVFGEAYPRERDDRMNQLPDGPEESGDEWDPFGEMDSRFYDALDGDGERFEQAADAYARNVLG
jgi:hypothetical protein